MCKTSSGLFPKNNVGKHLASAANKAVQNLIDNTPGARGKSMAVGAYDTKTGQIVAAFAGPVPDKIHPELLKRAAKIGGIGSLGLTEHNTVGVCAEFQVINTLLNNGSKISDIHLTKAIRPRTGRHIDYCANCKAMFSDIIDQGGTK